MRNARAFFTYRSQLNLNRRFGVYLGACGGSRQVPKEGRRAGKKCIYILCPIIYVFTCATGPKTIIIIITRAIWCDRFSADRRNYEVGAVHRISNGPRRTYYENPAEPQYSVHVHNIRNILMSLSGQSSGTILNTANTVSSAICTRKNAPSCLCLQRRPTYFYIFYSTRK